jgi:PAS domain S-box-containing protein
MNPNNTSSSIWRWWTLRYGLAFVAVAAGFGLRMALTAWVGPGLPTYITFYPAVMVAALLGGFGPGLLATALVALGTAYWILPPEGFFAIVSPVDRVGLLLFAGMGLFISIVAEFYRRNSRKAAAYDQEMALREIREALRQQVELIDPIRAKIIAQEMQRIVRERGSTGAAPVEPTSETLRRVPVVAGAAVAAIGALGLAGWMFDVTVFKSVAPSLTTMKFNTALCLLLASAALAWRDRRMLRWTCAVIIGLVAALSLAEYLTGANLHLDQFFVRDPGDLQTMPGRMAVSTALCFLFTGISLLLIGARARAALWAQQAAALVVIGFGMMALLGYAYEVRQFYGLADFSSMALNTALALTVLGAGLLCARPTGLVRVLVTSGPGTHLARLLLPVVILAPVIVGWLRVYGSKAGLFEPNFGTGLFAIAMILIFAALVWWTAHVLNRNDVARRETETQLRNLAEVMDHAHEPLIVRELGGVIRVWNRGAAVLYGWPAPEALGQRSHALLRTEGVSVTEQDAQLAQTGRWEGELIYTTRDGRRVTVESRQTASRIGDGQIFILESNLDITERKLAEETLRQSEEQYRSLFSSMLEGFCVVEVLFDANNRPVDYRFLEINPTFEAQTGLRNARGKRMRELAPEHEAHLFEIYGKVALTGEPARFENEAKALNRWFDVSAYRVGGPDSRKVAILFSDITERKQAEVALRESEAFTRRTLDSLFAFVAVLTPEGVVTDVNRAPLEAGGVALADVRGRKFWDCSWWNYDPQVQKQLRAACERAVGGDVSRYDVPVRMAGDSRMWIDFQIAPLREEHGPITHLIASAMNITERKRAEGALKKAHDELEKRVEERTAELHATSLYARGLLEASLDPLVTISPDGKITDVNKATELVTGVSRDRLIGSNFSDYFTEPDKANAGYQKVLAEGLVRDYPLTIRHTSGRLIDVLYNATVYRNEAGDVQGVFAAARNITEHKRAEAELAQYRQHLEKLVKQRTAELERSNHDLEQFAYVASHDLQEPLRAVGGYVKLLQHRFPKKLDAKALEYITGAAEGAERMQRLITDLLAFSRVGTQGGVLAPADLNALLRDALNNLQAGITGAGAMVTSDPLPTLPVNAAQIAQLFQNLIGNAIKFRSEQVPKIHVGVRKEEGRWVLWVRDNGIGIAPQYFERIFQIFQRLHTRKHYAGTGIGLAICKKIVERHGGSIWVESQPAQGSTFYFSIPEISAKKAT